MSARLFTAMLCLSLVLNAWSAPFAMAGAGHAGHSHAQIDESQPHRHDGHSASPAKDGGSTAPAHHAHHGHGMHADLGRPADAIEDPADQRCCDGPFCQCGCVLPQVVVIAGFEPSRIEPIAFAVAAPLQQRVEQFLSPPFRPPAA